MIIRSQLVRHFRRGQSNHRGASTSFCSWYRILLGNWKFCRGGLVSLSPLWLRARLLSYLLKILKTIRVENLQSFHKFKNIGNHSNWPTCSLPLLTQHVKNIRTDVGANGKRNVNTTASTVSSLWILIDRFDRAKNTTPTTLLAKKYALDETGIIMSWYCGALTGLRWERIHI